MAADDEEEEEEEAAEDAEQSETTEAEAAAFGKETREAEKELRMLREACEEDMYKYMMDEQGESEASEDGEGEGDEEESDEWDSLGTHAQGVASSSTSRGPSVPKTTKRP